MSIAGKRAPACLLAVLLLGTVGYFIARSRLNATIAREAAARQLEIRTLRGEKRLQGQMPAREVTAGADAASPLPPSGPANPTFRQAANLLGQGLLGTSGWTRVAGSSIADEVAAIGRALNLSDEQQAALVAAAEKAQQEVLAAVAAGARLRRTENEEPTGGLVTQEENQAFSQAMNSPDLSLDGQRTLALERLARQAAARGERQLVIEIGELPDARASFDAMQVAFGNIMGADAFALYRAAGASRTIESMFDTIGLQKHDLVVTSRAPGAMSDAMEARQRAAERAAARGSPALAMAMTTPPTVRTYDLMRIYTAGNWYEPPTRTEGGGPFAGGGTVGSVRPAGPPRIQYGGPTSMPVERLRATMGLLHTLVPDDL